MTSPVNTSYVPTMELSPGDLVRHMVTRDVYNVSTFPLVKYHDSEWVPGILYFKETKERGIEYFVRTREDFENKFIIVAGD